jgi:stage III sporulation protein AD
MELFLKATVVALVASVLGLVLQKQGKDISMLLILAVSVMIAIAAITYLEPVVTFMKKLAKLADLNDEMLRIILKTTGIGLVGELAGMVAVDAGNASLGKMIQMLTVGVVLWLSVPLLENLLDLVTSILGQV